MNAPEPRRVLDAPRVVIENVSPTVDGGRFAAKRIEGEPIVIEASAFADGHDRIACVLRYRAEAASAWSEVPMTSLGNDRWSASFTPDRIGTWFFCVHSWVDSLATWREQFLRREDPADIRRAARQGAELIAISASVSMRE